MDDKILSIHLTKRTIIKKTMTKERMGSHLEDTCTPLSLKCIATTADNLTAAARPVIKASKEKTARINPRRKPFINAARRNIMNRVSINKGIQLAAYVL
jgi:hypothetical protein